MTFKHASYANKRIIGIEGESKYDIFNDFIDWLDAENFDGDICTDLKRQLTDYGLNQE